MKQLITFLAAVVITVGVYAQTPNKISYQAVVRDSSNNLVTNQQVGVKIEVKEGSTVEYSETHTVTTNANGLFTLNIGDGSNLSGTWSNIDWDGNSPISVDVGVDPNGGSNYTLTSSSDMNTVPYAFHAETVSNETDPTFTASPANGITSGDIANWNASASASSPDFYIGQDTLGGIVFEIWTDSSGAQHGLIVSKIEGDTSWLSANILVNANRTYDGAYNTSQMTFSPAKTWIYTNFSSTWYLPSIDELRILYNARYYVNKAIAAGSGTLIRRDDRIWSSTESPFNNTTALYINFYNGSVSIEDKVVSQKIRAIREF